MRLFTICEDVQEGIDVSAVDGGVPALYVGEPGEGEAIPINNLLTQLFEERRNYIDRMEKLLERYRVEALRDAALREMTQLFEKAKKQRGYYADHLQEEEDAPLKHAQAWARECSLHMRILEGEIADSPPTRIIPARQPYYRTSECLVYVATHAPPGGDLWYEAATFKEIRYEGGGVGRQYDEFPGLGIHVLAEGKGPSDELHMLLKLERGAKFRIRRDGNFKLFEDEKGAPQRPQTLHINWTGSGLFASFPRPRKTSPHAA